MPSQIPLSSSFTLSYPETSVHTTASLGYVWRSHSSTPAVWSWLCAQPDNSAPSGSGNLDRENASDQSL